MKECHILRYTLTIGLTLLISLMYSQGFINATSKWKIKDLAYVDLVYFNSDYFDYIEGDTIIDNSTYFKVYRKGKSITGFTPTDSMFINEFHEYKGAILEENRKWYWVKKESIESTLLYDFNVSEGDSIKYFDSDVKYELQLIDSIYHGGIFKKIYKLEGLAINLIEGVGWNTGLLFPIHNYESFSYLQCFSSNGESLNPDLSEFELLTNVELEKVEECRELISRIVDQTNRNEPALVYPNPFQEKLIIKSETEIQEIIIINKIGQIIYNKKRYINELELDHLDSGIYNLIILTKAGPSIHTILKLNN